jgi:hypothetical protein
MVVTTDTGLPNPDVGFQSGRQQHLVFNLTVTNVAIHRQHGGSDQHVAGGRRFFR